MSSLEAIRGADIPIKGNIILPNTTNKGIQLNPDAAAFGYADIIGDISVRGIGSNDPTFSIYQGNIRAFEFSATSMKEVFLVFHVPHDYLPGSNIFFHAHWSNAAASPNTGNVVWGFEYTWAKGYNQMAFTVPATITVTQACPATRYKHNIAETTAVTLSGLEVDSLIQVRVYRDAANNADTCTDTAFLHTADIHYQTIGIKGTENKNFPFYST